MTSKLTTKQRNVLQKFLSYTDGVDQTLAIKFLTKYKWELDTAVDQYFEDPSSLQPVSSKSLISFFDKYKDPDSDIITEEGFDQLMGDLGIVEEDDLTSFVIAWECNCAKLSEFTRPEFEQGMKKLRCESLSKLKEQVPMLRSKIDNFETFKEFYNFMFVYAKASAEKKTLKKDLALALWDMLLPKHFVYLKEFKTFLADNKRDISKDTWQQLLDFAKLASEDKKLLNYDPNAAWPVLIDDFVEYLRNNNIVPKVESE